MTVGEVSPEMTREIDFDYEKFRERLIPEWQNVTDRLKNTNRGRQDLLDPSFRRFAVWNSWEIEQMSQLIIEGKVDPRELSSEEAHYLYYMHSSILDMSDRAPSLELLADAELMNIKTLESQNPEEALIKKRKLASILEELSTITTGDTAVDYANGALKLNNEVSSSSLLETVTSPRKIHAAFSECDIRMRSVLFGPHIESRHTILSREQAEGHVALLQFNNYRLLENMIAEASDTMRIGREPEDGAFGAQLVLARLIERIGENDQMYELEAANSFIRQDDGYIGKSFIDTDSESTEPNLTAMSKIAFDLNLINHQTNRNIPIEVKKLTAGSHANGKPGRYLPITEVIQFRLGSNRAEYHTIARNYCKAKIAQMANQKPKPVEVEAVDMFEGMVDPEIDRAFSRLANSEETATDYNERVTYTNLRS